MCLKKIGMMLSKSYKVNDLYVGLLGYVTKKDKSTISIKYNEKKFIIYRKVSFGYFDYVAEDIFTNKQYFFWKGNIYERDTIFRAVDNYVIYKSIPIEQFLPTLKSIVKKVWLLELYNKLNNPQIEHPKDEKKLNQSQ